MVSLVSQVLEEVLAFKVLPAWRALMELMDIREKREVLGKQVRAAFQVYPGHLANQVKRDLLVLKAYKDHQAKMGKWEKKGVEAFLVHLDIQESLGHLAGMEKMEFREELV